MQLESVFAGQIFEVFGVLVVNLVENLLQVLGLGSLHVLVQLSLLLFGEAGDISALGVCNRPLISLGGGVV